MNVCTRCGSDHINRKPKGEPATTPVAIVVVAVLVYICVKVFGVITGAGYVGGFFLLFAGGIIIGPAILFAAYILASAITGEGKTHTATCHTCGNEWHEKGACPPKQTAPSYPNR